VLDLGAGTGLLSAMVMERLPGGRLHLVDVSDAMLARARERFSGAADSNVSFEVRDYAHGSLGGPWDVVVSALSIHHLDDGAKRSLFARVFEALRPMGLFVNAEQVLGPTPAAEARYRRLWDEQVLGSGVDRGEYERAVERMRHDRCATLGISSNGCARRVSARSTVLSNSGASRSTSERGRRAHAEALPPPTADAVELGPQWAC
jgi:tRNA (cmo5U34)-methyltransferase